MSGGNLNKPFFTLLSIILCFSIILNCNKSTKIENKAKYQEWGVYLGDKGGTQYSSLTQINRSNVSNLKIAWVYHTKDKTDHSTIENNPIIINGIMYITSPTLKVIALNAKTGKEIWTFDAGGASNANRGVTYWSDGKDARILFTRGHFLYELDAHTGILVNKFGTNGRVDLRTGFDISDTLQTSVSATSPGIIYRNLIILGSRVGEGPSPSSPGTIRAYDVYTGQLVWNFHTIPHPGEYGYDTWSKNSWKTNGGANSWAGMSLDEKRGIVFISTGSPSYQFYAGNRIGNNIFANSVIALKAANGELVWHFQTVHHDLWDYDNPQPPTLVRIKHKGKYVDAVAQITKTGMVFVLDRETGKPLFPIEERPVPQSLLDGEVTSKTQPFTVKPPPFVRQGFKKSDLTNISEEAHQWALEKYKLYGSQKMFTPPKKAPGTVISPGFHGGGWWGGSAFDPKTGILYVNANNVPYVVSMVSTTGFDKTDVYSIGKNIFIANCASCHGANRGGNPPSIPSLRNVKGRLSKDKVIQTVKNGRGGMPSFSFSKEKMNAIISFLYNETDESIENPHNKRIVPSESNKMPKFVHKKYTQFRGPEGYPAVRPPWGTLNAIDLNKGKILWQVPLGEFKELTKRGIPPTGTENEGGPVVTAGGLVFIGASRDRKFRAFDKETGEILWETTLPHSAFSTPSIYTVDGKEYVVVAAGGICLYCSEGNHPKITNSESGDVYIAFTLQ